MTWNKLLGVKLASGWTVKSMRAKQPGDTGGNFSVQFLVEDGKATAFMKVFDLEGLFRATAGDGLQMQRELESINLEVKLLGLCHAADAKGVVVPLDIGKITVPGLNANQPIQYIIFELAEQDLRRYHNYRSNIDYVTNLLILRQVSFGLFELHELEISHQDLKPSNVVLFRNDISRVADLGRSSHRLTPVWHDAISFAGDPAYAPIEALYDRRCDNWHERRTSIDLYMLGSLTMFLFTSVSLTSQILSHLRSEFHPARWTDGYEAVVPYLRAALREAIQSQNSLSVGVGLQIQRVVRELCDPDPTKRGSPKIGPLPSRYSLRRYVSIFERLYHEVRVRGSIQ